MTRHATSRHIDGMSKRVSNKRGTQRKTPARSRKYKSSVIGVKVALTQWAAEERRKREAEEQRKAALSDVGGKPSFFQRVRKAFTGRLA